MRSKKSLFPGLTPPTKKPLPLIPQQIANNQDIRSVSARLGHAETSTTLNIYTHFLESTDKKAADILENVLVKHA